MQAIATITVATCYYLARLTNFPKGLYILPMFFVIFLFFNGRLSRPGSSEPNGPIFTKISGLVEGCKGLLLLLLLLLLLFLDPGTSFPWCETLSKVCGVWNDYNVTTVFYYYSY